MTVSTEYQYTVDGTTYDADIHALIVDGLAGGGVTLHSVGQHSYGKVRGRNKVKLTSGDLDNDETNDLVQVVTAAAATVGVTITPGQVRDLLIEMGKEIVKFKAVL
jgi:molybdopterin-binding protein